VQHGEQGEQHERPDEVELLLDGQRPQVRQRRAPAVQGVDPVGAVAERDAELPEGAAELDRVAGPRATRRRGEPRRVVEGQQQGRPDGEHDQQRGQQPAGPSGVEERERHAAVRADLVEQHRGDDEA
jgi:hypothetical protein